jgi:endonuclease/exonuclease/phosphatase family metal-dependent hydrolase
VTAVRVPRTRLTRWASDHLPVVADISLRGH